MWRRRSGRLRHKNVSIFHVLHDHEKRIVELYSLYICIYMYHIQVRTVITIKICIVYLSIMNPSYFRKSKRECFWFGFENSFQAEVERSSHFWLRLTPWSSVFGGNVFVTLKRWKSSKVARRGTLKTGWQNYNPLELGMKVEPFIELPYFTMDHGTELHDGINSPTFQGFCLNLKHPKHLKLVVKVGISSTSCKGESIPVLRKAYGKYMVVTSAFCCKRRETNSWFWWTDLSSLLYFGSVCFWGWCNLIIFYIYIYIRTPAVSYQGRCLVPVL